MPPRKRATATAKKAKAKPKVATKKAVPKKKPTPRRKAVVAPVDRPLTDKQRAFGDWFVSAEVNLNGTEAARRARYRGNDKTLAVIASENLSKPNVRAYIDAKLAKAMAGADVTVENVLRKLQTVYEKGVSSMQLSAAARAAELQGKYLKMFTDRIEHVDNLDSVPTEQLLGVLSELLEAGDVDLATITARHGSGHGGLPGAAGNKTTH